MEKLKFKVEKNPDGYWAYREEPGGLIGAYGETLFDLREEIVVAYNLSQDETKITAEQRLWRSNRSPPENIVNVKLWIDSNCTGM